SFLIYQKVLTEVENRVRRDPLSPWLLAELGRLYKALGRTSESSQLFAQAAQMEPADFNELLQLSVFLDEMNEPNAARIAFERGYADYWKRGMDPRMVGALVGYFPRQQHTEPRRELLDRIY